MPTERDFSSWTMPTVLLLSLGMLAIGCAPGQPTGQESDANDTTTGSSADSVPEEAVLKVASTTSTRDSGLLDVLLPEFEKANNCRVDLIAVGTGAALKLAEAGDVDAVLVHARSAENRFMDAGHGIRHEPIMHNFFIIAGPAADPAQASGTDAVSALQKIAAGKHRFVSRGDDSGTHKCEQSLWQKAESRPDWDDYIESGQGMGPTLIMADEMNAYVLTDEGTWLKQSENFQLVPLVRGAHDLKNPYAVIVVNPAKSSAINADLANQFADFLISRRAQQLIANYEINGHRLFHPDRLQRETPE
jgi:tungstate transport system substrate-binding protein